MTFLASQTKKAARGLRPRTALILVAVFTGADRPIRANVASGFE
jgi:hypothetical protein